MEIEFEGTPGPWKISDDVIENKHNTKGRCIDTDYDDDNNGGVEGILTVWMSEEDDIQKANLQLVSAAPELLAAAMDFINKVESGRARSVDSYGKFKAAVDKALGNGK